MYTNVPFWFQALCAQKTSASQLETGWHSNKKKKTEIVNKNDIAKK